MSYTTSKPVLPDSKPSFHGLRTRLAEALIRLGLAVARGTERAALRVAPWLRDEGES